MFDWLSAIDYWLWIALSLFMIGLLFTVWHDFSIWMLISTISLAGVIAYFGQGWYTNAILPTVNVIKFNQPIGALEIGSMMYIIMLVFVGIMFIANLLNSPRGKPTAWD